MSNVVKEIPCTDCVHRGICLHERDVFDVRDAIVNASVFKTFEDSDGRKKCSNKKVVNYDCVSSIEINCRHYKREIANTREAIF